MDKIIKWPGVTKLPIPPDEILEMSKGQYDRVVVIGVDNDGNPHLAASNPDLVVCNFDIDRAKAWIMAEVTA